VKVLSSAVDAGKSGTDGTFTKGKTGDRRDVHQFRSLLMKHDLYERWRILGRVGLHHQVEFASVVDVPEGH
jgi:hypothetical protein